MAAISPELHINGHSIVPSSLISSLNRSRTVSTVSKTCAGYGPSHDVTHLRLSHSLPRSSCHLRRQKLVLPSITWLSEFAHDLVLQKL